MQERAGPSPPSPREAVAHQEALRKRVMVHSCGVTIRRIAGVDVSVRKNLAVAAIALFTFPDLAPLETVTSSGPVTFPYLPGLLAFREAPVILAALARLKKRPDALLVDGQGLAHPRRCGLACHIGVEGDLPAIGIGKTRLIGKFKEPGKEKGGCSDLFDNGDIIGRVVRTRRGVAPVFVSVGHRFTLDEAVGVTLASLGRYRLPEPIRAAHKAAYEESARLVK